MRHCNKPVVGICPDLSAQRLRACTFFVGSDCHTTSLGVQALQWTQGKVCMWLKGSFVMAGNGEVCLLVKSVRSAQLAVNTCSGLVVFDAVNPCSGLGFGWLLITALGTSMLSALEVGWGRFYHCTCASCTT